jgi:hypothetical protein
LVPRTGHDQHGPASRNQANIGGSAVLPGWSYHGNPVTSVCGGQSGCLSISRFENRARCSLGECPSVRGFRSVAAGRPISLRRRCQGLANQPMPQLRNSRSCHCATRIKPQRGCEYRRIISRSVTQSESGLTGAKPRPRASTLSR